VKIKASLAKLAEKFEFFGPELSKIPALRPRGLAL